MSGDLVKIARGDLQLMRERLVKTAALQKRAELAERECDVLRRTLTLVGTGALDPASAMSKIAEFVAEPRRLDLFETAWSTGVDDATKIGTAVDGEPVDSEEGSSEEKFGRRLQKIVGAG